MCYNQTSSHKSTELASSTRLFIDFPILILYIESYFKICFIYSTWITKYLNNKTALTTCISPQTIQSNRLPPHLQIHTIHHAQGLPSTRITWSLAILLVGSFQLPTFLGSFGCFFYLNQPWTSKIWARSRDEHHNKIFFQGSKRHIPPLNKKLASEDVTQGVWKLWKESLRETINPPAFLIHFHRLGTNKLIKTTLPLAAFLLKRGNTTYLNQMYYLWNVYNLIGEM